MGFGHLECGKLFFHPGIVCGLSYIISTFQMIPYFLKIWVHLIASAIGTIITGGAWNKSNIVQVQEQYREREREADFAWTSLLRGVLYIYGCMFILRSLNSWDDITLSLLILLSSLLSSYLVSYAYLRCCTQTKHKHDNHSLSLSHMYAHKRKRKKISLSLLHTHKRKRKKNIHSTCASCHHIFSSSLHQMWRVIRTIVLVHHHNDRSNAR